MIIKREINLISIFTLDGSIILAIVPKIIVGAFIGILACILKFKFQFSFDYDFTSFTAFSVALSLFLGFRNNTCYDRWWEARKMWGRQIIVVRNYCQLLSLIAPPIPVTANQLVNKTKDVTLKINLNKWKKSNEYDEISNITRRLMLYASAHSHALRFQLRGDPSAVDEYRRYLNEYEIQVCSQSPNAADQILYFAHGLLRHLFLLSKKQEQKIYEKAHEDCPDYEINSERIANSIYNVRLQFPNESASSSQYDCNTRLVDDIGHSELNPHDGDTDPNLEMNDVTLTEERLNANNIAMNVEKDIGTLNITNAPPNGEIVLDSMILMQVHKHLVEMGFVQGACERILNTPLPFPYTLLVHRTTWLYIILAPFAMIDSTGWFTPVITAIIGYVFFGLDEVSQHLEHPFSTSTYSMPLSGLCRTIDISTNMGAGIYSKNMKNLSPDGVVLM